MPQLLCPLCRREIPCSNGAVPARTQGRSSDNVTSDSRGRGGHSLRHSSSRPFSFDVLRMNARGKLEGLPRRLVKQVLDTIASLDSGLDCRHKWAMLVDCASALEGATDAEARVDAEVRVDAVRFARRTLSDCIAYLIGKLQIQELVCIAPTFHGLSDTQAVDMAVLQKAAGVALSRGMSEISEMCTSWRELENLFWDLSELHKHCQLENAADDLSARFATMVFDFVRRTPSQQMPEALQQGLKLLDGWERASCEATVLFRSWLPGWLQQQANRTAHDLESFDARWWIGLLRTVGLHGLLERTRFVEVCDSLASGFAREGVRTKTTSSWSVDSLGVVVVRQFAAALAENPGGIRYEGFQLFFDCSGDWEGEFQTSSRKSEALAGRRAFKLAPLALTSSRFVRTMSSPELMPSPSSSQSNGRRSPIYSDYTLSPLGRGLDCQSPLQRRNRRSTFST